VEIRSKALGAIIAIVIFGGIMGATALGLWNTESVRNPAKLQISESIGNVAGENVGTGTGTYDPADIRGNHRFGEISEMFAIPLETLSRAFALPATVDPATFQNQDFESIYPEFDGEQEIGNGSMKWFVALYTGLPFELEDDEEDTYLLRPAVDILKSSADLSAEQIAYLDAYTIGACQKMKYKPAMKQMVMQRILYANRMKWSWRGRQPLPTFWLGVCLLSKSSPSLPAICPITWCWCMNTASKMDYLSGASRQTYSLR